MASDPAHLSVVRPTENDYRLNNYFIFWGAHALLTDPGGLHHANMFHPEPYAFVYADILLAHSILMLPVIELFYNPVLTFNILLLASLTIGGLGFFVLARELTDRPDVAFLGAVLWTFNPLHFTRYQQIQLVGDHWLPWMAWALWRWLQPRDETTDGSPYRWPATAALFFCLNALSGSHNAVFGAILAAIMIGYFALRNGRGLTWRFFAESLTFAGLCVVVLLPIFWPYLLVEQRLAASRAVTLDVPVASLRPLELFSARSRFYLWLDQVTGWPSVLNTQGRELWGYAFPGIVTPTLAVLGIAAAPRGGSRRKQGVWLIALAVFVFLAMGAYGGYLLVGNLPLVRLIRVPIRFMMPVTLALAVLATFGATILARRVESSAARLGLLLAIGLAFSAEATFAPLRTWPHEEEVRPVNQFLADQPGDFAIVEFPLDPFGYAINARQVYQSIYHWKRLLVGYSGFQSRENIELLRRVRDRFPTDECLDELNALDVRFVVVLRGRAKPSLLSAVAAQPRLERVLRADGRDMYRVLPPVTTAR